jgi:Smg protein
VEEEHMKETVLDVLMYLFESFVDGGEEPEHDRSNLRGDLERAGFGEREIERALDWLDGLNTTEIQTDSAATRTTTTRLYDRLEQDRIDTQCRGYLLHLEQIGILPPPQRELVIDRLLALGSDDIDIDQIKWVVMMVLFSQPGQEQAYEQMEDLVFAEDLGCLH